MRGFARAVVAGGIVAGTIDIVAASLIYQARPMIVLRSIAAGLVGAPLANSGGLRMALLGLALQWIMSLLIAAIFCSAALYFTWLLNKPLVSGLAYGVVIFFVMNYVVVPLSALAQMPHFSPLMFALNLAAMLLFGIIVSVGAHWAIAKPPAGV